MFHRACEETVFRLERRKRGASVGRGPGIGLADDPGWGVGYGDMEDLARADKIVQR